MKISSRRRGASLLAGLFAVSLTAVAQAQVLDPEQIFQLPPQGVTAFEAQGFPLTLGAGDIDASIVSDIGGVTLNDIAIMGIVPLALPPIDAGEGPEFEGSGRIWSLVHSSGSDTQALTVATPVDVPINSDNPDQCYIFPSSVQILDLDGDDTNDLAFLGACSDSINTGVSGFASAFGIQGTGSEPFQDPNSSIILGSQSSDAIFFPPLFFLGGQLALVTADFDGNGTTDLGFYDYSGTVPTDQLHTLLNNNNPENVPFEVSNVNGPVANPDFPGGIELASGDFNGDGIQDIAVAYVADPGNNGLQVYQGVGDGTFLQEPIAQADFGSPAIPVGLAAGNFDLNNFSDFAVTTINLDDGTTNIAIVLCGPGTPASCNVSFIDLGTTSNTLPGNIVSADFNGDGSDDLANVAINGGIAAGTPSTLSTVQLRLNDGGNFPTTPSQSFALDTTGLTISLISQVVAQDLDACGGPDLAYTGLAANDANGGGGGGGGITFQSIAQGVAEFEFQAGVAFNPNEAPVANAGSPIDVTGGVQVGGVPGGQPTCSDPTDDAMVIAWTVLSGEATFSDASASNPIVTGSGEVTVQVTCTDACGLSDSATVTIPAAGFIQGSCGTSLTGTMSAGFNATWLAIPALTGILALVRRRRS